MNGDIINTIFQLCAAGFTLNNCRILYIQKAVAGVSVMATAFWFTWGCYNIWYFNSLNQGLSALSSVLIVFGNLIWVILALYYRYKNGELDWKMK